MANNWKPNRAKAFIDARIKDVETVNIVDYKRDTSLESIPTNKAYRMDAVHLYVDIQNFEKILSSTEVNGVTAYQQRIYYNGTWKLDYDRCFEMLAGMYARDGQGIVARN